MDIVRILVTGDINGNFQECFNRVNKVNKKSGPFDMLLCVGNFFPNRKTEKPLNELTNSSLDVSLPSVATYILGPTTQEQIDYYKANATNDVNFENGCEVIEGVTLLGKKGVLTTSSGIKIAYLSGCEDSKSTEYSFNEEDVESLLMSASSSTTSIDILITSQWPTSVDKCLNECPPEVKSTAETGSKLVAKLACFLKPRYHFSSCGIHFERQPYRNYQILQEVAKPVTRFVSLAEVGNKSKAKWLYAFHITPSQKMTRAELVKQPPDTTECPYDEERNLVQKSKEESQIASQYFYDMNNYEQDDYEPRKRRGRNQAEHGKRNREDKPKDPCWFCLSSPEVEKHLVVSIGDHSYLAMAKGGLVKEHLLILPIGHFRSVLELKEEDVEVLSEIQKFKKALSDLFGKQDKMVVYYERNYRSSHLQIQAVPVPLSKKESIKELLVELSEERGNPLIAIEEALELKDVLSPGIPYFYIEIPAADVKLFCKIHASKGFPLQLGRELLAHPRILNLGQRIEWKNCALGKEEASEATNKFRKNFEPFDFTLS